tara:strand:+ start:5304 stop:6584 length:1281 start_codon:yes stop_codon:yes gene_type:complete
MTAIPSTKIDTMAVSKNWLLYYNPEFMESTPKNLLVTVLIHEVSHLIRGHGERGQSLGVCARTAKLWNYAADAEINDDLVYERFEFPGVPILPEFFKLPENLLAEDYYASVDIEDPPRPPVGSSHCPSCNSRRLRGTGVTRSGKLMVKITCLDCGWTDYVDPASSGNSRSPSDIESDSEEDQDSNPDPNSGSGSDGIDRDYEDANDSENALSQVDSEIVRQRVAIEIQNHQKSRGRVSASWKRFADARTEVQKISWQTLLTAHIKRAFSFVAGRVDYTYRKRSRRQSISEEIIFRSMHRPQPSIVLVQDTSGSMSDSMLSDCLVQIQAIIKNCGGTVRAMAVDAEVQNLQRIQKAKDFKLSGGGGTDMVLGFAAAAKLRPKPDIIICLTDGYTPWPTPKVLGGIIGIVACTTSVDIPSFLKTVRVK